MDKVSGNLDKFVDKIVVDMDRLLYMASKEPNIDVGVLAMKMLLKFEIGKYFIDKNSSISEKGKRIAEMIYVELDDILTKEMSHFFNGIELIPIKKEIILKVGEKLYKQNRLE